jgi:hypothetical protein
MVGGGGGGRFWWWWWWWVVAAVAGGGSGCGRSGGGGGGGGGARAADQWAPLPWIFFFCFMKIALPRATLQETQALPSVYGFAEGLLSGTRQS